MSLLLADECIEPPTVDLFRRHGHNVLYASQSELQGQTDQALLDLATDQKRIFVTVNYRHFSRLNRFPLGSHAGILILRILPPHWREINPILDRFLRTVDLDRLQGKLVILRRQHYRVSHTEDLHEEFPLLP